MNNSFSSSPDPALVGGEACTRQERDKYVFCRKLGAGNLPGAASHARKTSLGALSLFGLLLSDLGNRLSFLWSSGRQVVAIGFQVVEERLPTRGKRKFRGSFHLNSFVVSVLLCCTTTTQTGRQCHCLQHSMSRSFVHSLSVFP